MTRLWAWERTMCNIRFTQMPLYPFYPCSRRIRNTLELTSKGTQWHEMQIQNKCFSWLNRQKPGELRTSCNNSAYVLNDAAFRPYWMTYIPFIPSSLLVCNPAQACQQSYVVSKLRCKHSVFKQRWSNRQAYWFTLRVLPVTFLHIAASFTVFYPTSSGCIPWATMTYTTVKLNRVSFQWL